MLRRATNERARARFEPLNLKTYHEHFIRICEFFWQIFSSTGLVFSRLYSYWPFGGVLAHFFEESYPSPFSNKLR